MPMSADLPPFLFLFLRMFRQYTVLVFIPAGVPADLILYSAGCSVDVFFNSAEFPQDWVSHWRISHRNQFSLSQECEWEPVSAELNTTFPNWRNRSAATQRVLIRQKTFSPAKAFGPGGMGFVSEENPAEVPPIQPYSGGYYAGFSQSADFTCPDLHTVNGRK